MLADNTIDVSLIQTVMASEITNVKQLQGAVEVHFENKKKIRFEDCWLRDQCRCASCYHADKYQRANHLLETPDANIVSLRFDKSQLVFKWDDNHESTYPSSFLLQFDYKSWSTSRRMNPILWRGSSVAEKVARVPIETFLGDVEGIRRVFRSLLDYGVALIEGVDPTQEATEKVCTALGGVQHTLFGGMWRVINYADHADTAYTTLPLALHNDNTYFTEAAGLQVFHCLKSTNTGGETILADGFFGATSLKEDCPESFEFLATFDVEAEYLEEGHHYRYSAPVIRVDWKTDELKQIRFNAYDRSTMAFKNSDECRAYYRSLKKLAQYYENKDNQWEIKLNPGTVIVIDNFRVLHGRRGFTGERVLCGSYVSRADWLDQARVLGLIQ